MKRNKISYTFRILKGIDNVINFVLTALLKVVRFLYLWNVKLFKKLLQLIEDVKFSGIYHFVKHKWYVWNEKLRPFTTNGYKYEKYLEEKCNHPMI